MCVHAYPPPPVDSPPSPPRTLHSAHCTPHTALRRRTRPHRYNNMYIYATDALTAHYPRLTDDGVNSYARTHLEMHL